jgi:hypothetical protein
LKIQPPRPFFWKGNTVIDIYKEISVKRNIENQAINMQLFGNEMGEK